MGVCTPAVSWLDVKVPALQEQDEWRFIWCSLPAELFPPAVNPIFFLRLSRVNLRVDSSMEESKEESNV
jgi:hypothetical protein